MNLTTHRKQVQGVPRIPFEPRWDRHPSDPLQVKPFLPMVAQEHSGSAGQAPLRRVRDMLKPGPSLRQIDAMLQQRRQLVQQSVPHDFRERMSPATAVVASTTICVLVMCIIPIVLSFSANPDEYALHAFGTLGCLWLLLILLFIAHSESKRRTGELSLWEDIRADFKARREDRERNRLFTEHVKRLIKAELDRSS